MSDISANLSIPYIQPSQAQKHVTHNEGMRHLDTLVQLSVEAADQPAPPAAPTNGERHLLPVGAMGAWAGHDHAIATFEENGWAFYPPRAGWRAWDRNTATELVFDGSKWEPTASQTQLQNMEFLGVQTTADPINRLAVSSAASLLTHDGAGHQLKMNKAATSDTASLLFQTGWSGRAEMGTVGSDDFCIKVSADGTNFHQVMVADASTGKASFPNGLTGLTNAEFGEGALLTVDYAASKGLDLVTNSTGLLGNGYNYPPEFTYDPVVTPNLPASFSFAGYHTGTVSMTELLPVDPNRVYRLGSYLRQQGVAGDWSAYAKAERHSQYMGLICLDADKQVIEALHHMRYKHAGTDSMTTLAAPLTPGDTTVALTNSAGWNESGTAAYNRGITIFGYKNSLGYQYRHYSRLVEFDMFALGQVNKTTHVVTLNKPLAAAMGNPDSPTGTWPAGTPIANSSSGSTYKYAFYAGVFVPEVDRWYRTKGFLGGIDTSGTNYSSNFPPGTTYVLPFWLPNYTNYAGGYGGYPDTGSGHKVWFAGASVVPEPLAVMSEVLTGSGTGRKEVKVPVADFNSGSISLSYTLQSITPA